MGSSPAPVFPGGCHALRWVAAVLCAGLLCGGCAIGGAVSPSLPPLRDEAFAAPRETPDAESVFSLSPGMAAYAGRLAAAHGRVPDAQRRLVRSLASDGLLRLEYDAARTRTASESFEARAGNCLSLAIMTAALARELGLPAVFQAFDAGDDSFSRTAGLVVANGHVNLVLGSRLLDRARGRGTDSQLVVDFVASAQAPMRGGVPVNDRRILAMFFNNRAAESLALDDLDQAYAFARAALLQDAGFPSTAITLGLVYQRRGLVQDAQLAFEHALARQPANPQALANLAVLLEAAGRAAEAEHYRQALLRVEKVPPFHYVDLGRAALARGDRAGAITLLKHELARDPNYHEAHYWMAVALAAEGRLAAADRHLAQAMAHSGTREEHRLYAAKLDRLRASAGRVEVGVGRLPGRPRLAP